MGAVSDTRRSASVWRAFEHRLRAAGQAGDEATGRPRRRRVASTRRRCPSAAWWRATASAARSSPSSWATSAPVAWRNSATGAVELGVPKWRAPEVERPSAGLQPTIRVAGGQVGSQEHAGDRRLETGVEVAARATVERRRESWPSPRRVAHPELRPAPPAPHGSWRTRASRCRAAGPSLAAGRGRPGRWRAGRRRSPPCPG